MPEIFLYPNGWTTPSNYESVIGASDPAVAVADASDGTYVIMYGVAGELTLVLPDDVIPEFAVAHSFQGGFRVRSTGTGARVPLPRLQVYDAATGNILIDHSYELSSTSIFNVSSPTVTGHSFSRGNLNNLRMKAVAQGGSGGDAGQKWNLIHANVRVVYAEAPSAPTVLSPSGTVVTRYPRIIWTHNPGAGALSGQGAFRIKVFSAAQYQAAGFNPSTSPTSYDSGHVTTSDSMHDIVGAGLVNGVTYRAYVETYQYTNGYSQPSGWGYTTFTVSITVPTPTDVTPAHGATASTSRPPVAAAVESSAVGGVYRQFQWALNPGFSSPITYTDLDGGYRPKSSWGVHQMLLMPTGSRLAQGSWYLRARAIDQSGVASAWSATNAVIINHVPTTTARTPSGNSTRVYNGSVLLGWTFSDVDVDDYQTAFEVELWKLSDPGGFLTSGKQLSSASSYLFSGLDSTWRDTDLRWRVRVWDRDDVYSAWSPDSGFFLRDAPAITIISPAEGGTVNTSRPSVVWSHSASNARTQSQFKVDVYNVTAGLELVATSDWVVSGATTWTPSVPIVEVGPQYSVTVSIIDNEGLTSSETNLFTAAFSAPPSPSFSVDSSRYSKEGVRVIDWSGVEADSSFVAWRVYRSIAGDPTWRLQGDFADIDTRTYSDYTSPSMTDVRYVVVQVITQLGSEIESAYVASEAQNDVLHHYVLSCPADSVLNLPLYHVTGDSFSDEQEQAVLNLMGRGRRMEYGTRYGITGTLDVSFFDNPTMTARRQRLALEQLRDSHKEVFLLNPFGDVYKVGLMSTTVTRVRGTGLHEMTTGSIQYSEITA